MLKAIKAVSFRIDAIVACRRYRSACLALLFVLTSNAAYAQPDLRELVVDFDLWEVYSLDELAGFFADGLSRESTEDRELALAGVIRLGMADPDLARASFDLDVIESLFEDNNTDVLKNALAVYVQLAPDDAAARALVSHMENPPRSVLPDVMHLIRSPEYFGDGSLTQRLPKFGASAVPYLGELRELRVVLLNRIGTANERRPGGQLLRTYDVDMIDQAIEALEN